MQNSGIAEAITEDALAALQPDLPADALESVFRKLTRPEGSTLATRNGAFHRMLTWGVQVGGGR